MIRAASWLAAFGFATLCTAAHAQGLRKDPFLLPMNIVTKLEAHRFEFVTEGTISGIQHHVLDDRARVITHSGTNVPCVQWSRVTTVVLRNGFTTKVDEYKTLSEQKCDTQADQHSVMIPIVHAFCRCMEGPEPGDEACSVQADKGLEAKGFGTRWAGFEDLGQVTDYWTCPAPPSKKWDRVWESWDFNIRLGRQPRPSSRQALERAAEATRRQEQARAAQVEWEQRRAAEEQRRAAEANEARRRLAEQRAQDALVRFMAQHSLPGTASCDQVHRAMRPNPHPGLFAPAKVPVIVGETDDDAQARCRQLRASLNETAQPPEAAGP